ncbi:ATP-binding cassette domain-containing protein [Propionicicella superfundia]|uniref:ATP-binding cassette domain-containing protein n=1 Tax=Propionicicella superfundia TaxID=348582 RepID=UPI000422BAEF|nr:ATP-binding cassette domain-containing protein [Propionicicella superfundia]
MDGDLSSPASLPTWALVALGVWVVLELVLYAVALVVLARTPRERLSLPKWAWAVVILAVQVVGAIVFLAAGRRPVPVADEARRALPSQPADPGMVGLLYGPSPVSGDASAVEIGGLVRSFGDVRALDGVDLAVPAGSVYGFLGPNGAGKTTTLRILLGLLAADVGTVRVLGAEPGQARREVGFLPDVPGFYPWMTAPEFLRFAGSLFGLPSDVVDQRVPALLDLAGLGGVRTRIGGYSRGMRQRLGIAQALVNAPSLLLLDEPTSALDPLGRKDVLDMIESLRGRTTVLFSTHILTDAERVCDRVAVLDHGRVADAGTVAELIARHADTTRLSLVVDGDAAAFAAALRREPWVVAVEQSFADPATMEFRVSDRPAALRGVPRLLAATGSALVRFDGSEATLEDAFVRLVAPGSATAVAS